MAPELLKAVPKLVSPETFKKPPGLDAIKDAEIEDNMLVVFASDNGPGPRCSGGNQTSVSSMRRAGQALKR